jgi:glycosyltransferase involved in cell wall biosynthesis
MIQNARNPHPHFDFPGNATTRAADCTRAPMRVLHTPTNIGNQPWILSRNERKLGVESDLVVHYLPPSFLYPADQTLGGLGGKSEQELLARIAAGLKAPLDYDVLHYYFGRTLFSWDDYESGSPFRYLDLKIAKALGRRIIFTLQGCDARLAGESTIRNEFTPCRHGFCRFFDACIATHDAKRRELIADALPEADKVFYLNPELGHYVPHGEFLPYSNVEVRDFEVLPPKAAGPITIVHAPSDGSIKGTPAILQALESLKDRYDFELILVQNLPHEEAMLMYRRADLVIDQVLAGWYGGLAVEVMAMGKPVLCYLREADFVNVPAAMIADLPIQNIRPDHLVHDIASVLDQRDRWAEWSARSRRYVEKWHNPARIAAAMIDVYADPSRSLDLAARI